ncbi:hypothetical protein EVAR_67487_1 [Eumeta japonica]|uniref:PiggyBac transposable element-derived protein domain-containing protein n=1 Tax=Eumeta variegata TaxID=151549 RepID=A0A4C1ZIK7_EUMVA|nr:hypothetical protein EVAR_67487_1 [Eumeta japonica]
MSSARLLSPRRTRNVKRRALSSRGSHRPHQRYVVTYFSEEDEIVFDLSGEEFDVAPEDKEPDSELEENDAGSTSSDSKMDVPLCTLTTVPVEGTYRDEELMAFRGCCKFRQYLLSKPAKYDIKIFALVDAATYYSLNLEIYAGDQPQGDYKTCVPEKFKAGKREEYSSILGFQHGLTLVSYVPRHRKNVFLLSSLHHQMEIDLAMGAKQKPEIISFYNRTKSGMDNVDKLTRSYDVSQVKSNRKSFIKSLASALLEPHLQSRKNNPRLSKDIRKRIAERADDQDCPPLKKSTPGIKRRCHVCPVKKDRKTQYIYFQKYLADLDVVFRKLERFGLRVNRNKSVFSRSSVKFIGHVPVPGGFQIDPEKDSAITASEYKTPKALSANVELIQALYNRIRRDRLSHN